LTKLYIWYFLFRPENTILNKTQPLNKYVFDYQEVIKMKKLIKRSKNQTGAVSAYSSKVCDRWCPCHNCLGMQSKSTAKAHISAANIEDDRKYRNK
jgi:hypothetical protein